MTKSQIKDYGIRITQANGAELVAITLEIAAEYISEAADSIENISAFRDLLGKARTFINQLIRSLDMRYKISSELLSIYLYVNSELQKADIRKNSELLPRLKDIIVNLSGAFREVGKEDKSGKVMENAQQVYAGLTYSKESLNENIYSDPGRGYTV